jgi:hypothetical protein
MAVAVETESANMSGIIDGITGAGAKRARREAEIGRKQQAVEQTRQLSVLNTQAAADAPVRRNPRGRRLFADAAVADLPATVA